VAQRTGAERFLASAAKTASARATLALAVAVIALAGCGGGSAEPAQQDPATATSADAPTGEGASPSPPAKAEDKAPAKQGSTPTSNTASPQQEQGGGGAGAAKHGPRIAQPKGPAEQAPSPAEVANATVADISLQSPSLIQTSEGPLRIPATYTCDGQGSWPELRWAGVPADSAELILYAMSAQPVEEQLFVDWAVAGLEPSLEGIEQGRLPKGAVVGTNGFGKRGYEICPPGAEIYMFALYALPQALSPQAGFDARELRRRILDVSGNVGLLPAFYARG
jgi:phosphatidylethanolamine-binding protein (PEBP) family uncharacterized protein